jgi:hypothetical protein
VHDCFRYLQETLPYIDANNTGIWGWSYGGFATAWVLVQDKQNVFKFGLSVAPVTSFIYYGTTSAVWSTSMVVNLQIRSTLRGIWVFRPMKIIWEVTTGQMSREEWSCSETNSSS